MTSRVSVVAMSVLLVLSRAQRAVEAIGGLRWAGAEAVVRGVRRTLELNRRVGDAVGVAEHVGDAIQYRRAVARR